MVCYVRLSSSIPNSLYKRELLLPFLNLLFVLARRLKLHMQVILYFAFIGLSEPNNFFYQAKKKNTHTIQKGNETEK